MRNIYHQMMHSFLLTLLLCLSSQTSYAQSSLIYYSYEACSPENLVVIAKNNSLNDQAFWFQFNHPFFEEQREIVQQKTQVKIRGEYFLDKTQVFSIKTFSSQLEFTVSCSERTLPLSKNTGTHFKIKPDHQGNVILYLLNLYPEANTAQIHFRNSSGGIIQTQNVDLKNYFETSKIKLKAPSNTSFVEVHFQSRVAYASYDSHEQPLISTPIGPEIFPKNTKLRYFLVSKKESFDESFVFASSDPNTIRLAREQISNPLLEKIIVAQISPGNNATNRDFAQKLAPQYSWHVSHVDAFADFAHIDCDGSPQLVEERIAERLYEKNGRVCFWSYRVVRELSPQEVSSGRLTSPMQLDLVSQLPSL